MSPVLETKIGELASLCSKRRVRRLALFGSATAGGFDSSTSDVDVLVEFQVMPPAEHADGTSDFKKTCSDSLGCRWIWSSPGQSAILTFRQAVEQTKVVLYEAA